ncbi:hypothetical protein G4B88_016554 [Cannabis sativa]|uniref:Uncharacterized protein n=1 Tax=Cannabis sativa TaxID=3483 RepID=A0A7J6H7L1_CANSA|nr:hypothetical protein G4B88_016554 [Cannabis sativa]
MHLLEIGLQFHMKDLQMPIVFGFLDKQFMAPQGDLIKWEDVNFFIVPSSAVPYPTAVTPWSNCVPHSPVKTPLEYNWNSEPPASIATEIGWLATAFSKDFSLLAGTSSCDHTEPSTAHVVLTLKHRSMFDIATERAIWLKLRLRLDKCLSLNHTTIKLVEDMSKLEELHLDDVNLSSTLPKSMQNLSSLISLSLSSCRLYGEFPQYIFHLPNIQAIDVSANENLSGFLPVNFCSGSKLKSLNLSLVSSLDLRFNNFNGQFPSALYNI